MRVGLKKERNNKTANWFGINHPSNLVIGQSHNLWIKILARSSNQPINFETPRWKINKWNSNFTLSKPYSSEQRKEEYNLLRNYCKQLSSNDMEGSRFLPCSCPAKVYPEGEDRHRPAVVLSPPHDDWQCCTSHERIPSHLLLSTRPLQMGVAEVWGGTNLGLRYPGIAVDRFRHAPSIGCAFARYQPLIPGSQKIVRNCYRFVNSRYEKIVINLSAKRWQLRSHVPDLLSRQLG